MGRNLQDVLHLIICLVILPTGVVEAACQTQNCEDCNGNTCTTCSAGYYLYNNLCSSCDTRCTVCVGPNYYQCSACNDGYYLSGSTCNPCDPRCTLCSGPSFSDCSDCNDGYYLSGSYCAVCGYQCTLCSGSRYSRVCSECKDGYYLSGSHCAWCGYQCTLCSGSGYISVCSECKDGYYLSGSHCGSCNSRCRACTGRYPNECSDCTDGYYLSGSTCNKCSSSCVNCSSSSICSECKSGTFRYGSSGYYRCAQCPTGCSQCYAINDDFQDPICTDCSLGYFKQSDGCTECPTSCTACSSSTSCSDCVTGKWGTQCLTSCGTHCTGNECTPSTGACTQGRDSGYYGEGADKEQASAIGPALGGAIGALCVIIVATTCIIVLYRKGYTCTCSIKKPGNASQTYTDTTYENDVEIAVNHDAASSGDVTGHHEYESPMEYEMIQRREENEDPYDVLQLPST